MNYYFSMCMCVVYVGPSSTSGVFLNHSTLYFEAGSLNSELFDTTKIASQLALRLSCSCLLSTGITGAYTCPPHTCMSSMYLNSSPHALAAKELVIK